MSTIDTKNVSGMASAKARSAAYSLISIGFRYPDEHWLGTLADPAPWIEWPQCITEIDPAAAERLQPVRQAVDRAVGDGHLGDLQDVYAGLFGHAVRGSCPPYELEYGQSEIIQRAADLADIAGFYAAFGLEHRGRISERPDHVSVECEFMHVLAGKEAYGIEHDDRPLAEACRDAQRKFLKAHLGHWIPGFARRVHQADREGFYGRLAAFGEAFVSGDCRRFNVSCGSPYLELRSTDPVEEVSQSCGIPGAGSGGTERLVPLTVKTSDNC